MSQGQYSPTTNIPKGTVVAISLYRHHRLSLVLNAHTCKRRLHRWGEEDPRLKAFKQHIRDIGSSYIIRLPNNVCLFFPHNVEQQCAHVTYFKRFLIVSCCVSLKSQSSPAALGRVWTPDIWKINTAASSCGFTQAQAEAMQQAARCCMWSQWQQPSSDIQKHA